LKFFLVIAGVLSLLSVPVGGVVAMISPMLLDAPGSEANSLLMFMVAAVFAYPLTALIGPVLSWISYRKGHRRLSTAFMAMPVMPVTAVLLGYIILIAA
jgi:hypothetical protein